MKNNITFYSNPFVAISLVFITGMTNLVTISYAQSPWTTKSPMPTARYVLSSSVVEGIIYAIGGDADSRTTVVEAYDPVTDTWTRKANMPMGRGAGASSVVNGKIYAIGGAQTYLGAPLSTVEVYDPAADTWTRKADMPTPRTGVSTSVVNGKIYAIGGSPGYGQWYEGLSTVEEYDSATDTWTRKADTPTPRTYFSTSVVNGEIYAIGGLPTGSNHLSQVEVYNPVTDTWRRVADMPTARSGLATSAVNGKIYTIGGFIGSGTVLSAVEKYDPSKDLSGLIDDVYLSQYFVVAGSDSVCITTTISDPTGVTLFAEIEAPDQTPIDSLQLFDDGNHNDGNAGDSLYANVWPVSSMEERDYYVDLKVTQNEAETICHQMDNIAVFTTNGPISYESYTLKSSDTEPNPGDVLNMKVTLKNGGTTATALNIKAKLSSLNEFATVTSDVYRNFSNIAAGESKTSTSYYQLEISEDCPDNTEIQFVLDITSNGNSFWSDNFSILVLISATNVNTIENSPRQYSLDQNYPNPFNPSTKISYSIPISGFVELKVYDMLGREIQTLVSKFQNANTYSVNYNASNLANGIYLYKLQTDDGYSEMKKMIIIK